MSIPRSAAAHATLPRGKAGIKINKWMVSKQWATSNLHQTKTTNVVDSEDNLSTWGQQSKSHLVK